MIPFSPAMIANGVTWMPSDELTRSPSSRILMFDGSHFGVAAGALVYTSVIGTDAEAASRSASTLSQVGHDEETKSISPGRQALVPNRPSSRWPTRREYGIGWCVL